MAPSRGHSRKSGGSLAKSRNTDNISKCFMANQPSQSVSSIPSIRFHDFKQTYSSSTKNDQLVHVTKATNTTQCLDISCNSDDFKSIERLHESTISECPGTAEEVTVSLPDHVLSTCAVCLHRYPSPLMCTQHMKVCAARHQLQGPQLLAAVRLYRQQCRSRLQAGLPLLSRTSAAGVSSDSVSANTAVSAAKLSRQSSFYRRNSKNTRAVTSHNFRRAGKADSTDIQLALALSVSLAHQSEQTNSAPSLLEECDNLTPGEQRASLVLSGLCKPKLQEINKSKFSVLSTASIESRYSILQKRLSTVLSNSLSHTKSESLSQNEEIILNNVNKSDIWNFSFQIFPNESYIVEKFASSWITNTTDLWLEENTISYPTHDCYNNALRKTTNSPTRLNLLSDNPEKPRTDCRNSQHEVSSAESFVRHGQTDNLISKIQHPASVINQCHIAIDHQSTNEIADKFNNECKSNDKLSPNSNSFISHSHENSEGNVVYGVTNECSISLINNDTSSENDFTHNNCCHFESSSVHDANLVVNANILQICSNDFNQPNFEKDLSSLFSSKLYPKESFDLSISPRFHSITETPAFSADLSSSPTVTVSDHLSRIDQKRVCADQNSFSDRDKKTSDIVTSIAATPDTGLCNDGSGLCIVDSVKQDFGSKSNCWSRFQYLRVSSFSLGHMLWNSLLDSSYSDDDVIDLVSLDNSLLVCHSVVFSVHCNGLLTVQAAKSLFGRYTTCVIVHALYFMYNFTLALHHLDDLLDFDAVLRLIRELGLYKRLLRLVPDICNNVDILKKVNTELEFPDDYSSTDDRGINRLLFEVFMSKRLSYDNSSEACISMDTVQRVEHNKQNVDRDDITKQKLLDGKHEQVQPIIDNDCSIDDISEIIRSSFTNDSYLTNTSPKSTFSQFSQNESTDAPRKSVDASYNIFDTCQQNRVCQDDCDVLGASCPKSSGDIDGSLIYVSCHNLSQSRSSSMAQQTIDERKDSQPDVECLNPLGNVWQDFEDMGFVEVDSAQSMFTSSQAQNSHTVSCADDSADTAKCLNNASSRPYECTSNDTSIVIEDFNDKSISHGCTPAARHVFVHDCDSEIDMASDLSPESNLEYSMSNSSSQSTHKRHKSSCTSTESHSCHDVTRDVAFVHTSVAETMCGNSQNIPSITTVATCVGNTHTTCGGYDISAETFTTPSRRTVQCPASKLFSASQSRHLSHNKTNKRCRNSYSIVDSTSPLLDYAIMLTPQLKEHLSRIGVKPLSRNKALALFSQIYKQTHVQVANTSVQCDPVSCHSRDSSSSDTETRTADTAARCHTPSRVSSRECLEETIFIDDMSDHDTLSQMNSVKNKLIQYIRSHHDLYIQVLTYRPLHLDDLHARMKRDELVVSKRTLVEFLDQQCITFKLETNEKAGKKRKFRSRWKRKQ